MMVSNSNSGYNENQFNRLLSKAMYWKFLRGSLTALVWAQMSTIALKSMVLGILCSIGNNDRDTSLSCFVDFLTSFFTWDIL